MRAPHLFSQYTLSCGHTPSWLCRNARGAELRDPWATGAPLSLYPQPGPTHLKGLPAEVTATELALQSPLGAVMLQVRGQIPAAQLGGAAVGAGDYIEAAGIQVALVGGATVSACPGRGSPPTPAPSEPHL